MHSFSFKARGMLTATFQLLNEQNKYWNFLLINMSWMLLQIWIHLWIYEFSKVQFSVIWIFNTGQETCKLIPHCTELWLKFILEFWMTSSNPIFVFLTEFYIYFFGKLHIYSKKVTRQHFKILILMDLWKIKPLI